MLKIGIVGTGAIARSHVAALRILSGKVALCRAYDTSNERLNEFILQYPSVSPCSSARDLFEDSEVELIVITTPPSTHEELITSALLSGKYVLCEKPIAHTPESAERIADFARNYVGRLCFNHQLRFDRRYQKLLSACKQNLLGEIQSVCVERHGSRFDSNTWWGTWGVAGGGVLITQLIHQLDLIIELLGMPRSVTSAMDTRYSRIESEDWIEATLHFENGARATCAASVNSGKFGSEFKIQGSHGSLEFPWKLRLDNATPREQQDIFSENEIPSQARPSQILRKLRQPPVNQDLMAFAHLYNQIADNICVGVDLPVGPDAAIKSLLVCYAAYEAAITGQSVQLPILPSGPVYRGITAELYATRPELQKSKSLGTLSKSMSKPLHENVRIGLIGLDTSHAVTFTSILNDPLSPMHIPGSAVVAAYPGGSADMEISCSRVASFTETLRDQFRVEMKSSPEEVAQACDFVFILSCDGRTHLPLVRRIASCGKPVFLDKPFATREADAREIFQIADEFGVTIFGASAFRYAESLIQLLRNIRARAERIVSCEVRFSLQIQPTQGKYFWYGIHAAEMLMVTMGSPFQSVNVVHQEDSDLIHVQHADGRISQMIGSSTNRNFSIAIETDKQKYQLDLAHAMLTMSSQLLWAVLDKLSKGNYPQLWSGTSAGSVSGSRPSRDFDPHPADTIEIIRLLEAAQYCVEANKQGAISNHNSLVPSRQTEFEQNAETNATAPPFRKKPWPRRKHIGLEERDAVLALMNREISEGGALAYGGIENRAYCSAFSEYLGGGFSLAVNSGTSALYVALRALDLQPGSEVIVPAISDPGGVMPVALLNCIPVPADTAFSSLNTSVQQIRSVVSERTRAVIVAHIGGHPVDIDPIVALAHDRGIAVIEDCAQSHGATYHGQKTGTCGDIAVFSTMYGKQHCTGSQGGVVFTRSSLLFARARQIADRGKPFGVVGNVSNMVASMNFNQDEISLAIGRAQLEKLPQAIKLRREFALSVADGLAGIDGVQMLVDPANCESSYWFLQLQFDAGKLRCTASQFASSLSSEGIGGIACGYPFYPSAQIWSRDAVVFGASGHPWSLVYGQSRPQFAIPNALAANRNLIRVDVHEALGPTEASDLVAAVAEVVKRCHVNS